MSKFLSTLSLRRATRFFDVSLNYFYPRSPCGERLNKRCEFNGDNRFLSTLSLRRATVSVWCFCGGAFGFLSTLSLRRATADAPQDGPQLGFLSTLSLRRATIPDREPAAGYLISIHALLAESDPTRWAPTCRISNFYPRSPCGERPSLLYSSSCIHRFLSTLSLRRATPRFDTFWSAYPKFLSTLSLRRATARTHCLPPQAQISIHALLAESDFAPIYCTGPESNFYPRSPCGERHFDRLQICLQAGISIHALLAESDILRSCPMPRCQNFYPRSPCGERRKNRMTTSKRVLISIHALLAESDV